MKPKRIAMITAVILVCVSIGTAWQVGRLTMEVVETSRYTWGSTGSTVREIQNRLRSWGFYDGAVDGVYGQKTWSAVRRFQARHGLKVDGITGPATLEKLGLPTGRAATGQTTAGQTAAAPAATPTATQSAYSWGARGEVVREIQRRLQQWGFYTGTVDGVYGARTWNAVRDFQRRHGLTVDGVAGRATLEKMGIPVRTQATATGSHDRDIYLMAAAINGEARGEPYLGQVAVGAVILNRVRHSSFPNTIAGVIYQPGAFDAVRDGQINLAPQESTFRAARDAMNGWDPTGGCIYYWNPVTATSRWIWSRPILKQIGKHVFAK